MPGPIVLLNVTQTTPPAPSTLQSTGAIISQGGTTKAAGTLTLITQLADLTAILSSAKALTSLTWTSSVVTGTTTAPHGWTSGDIIPVTIAGAAPAGYNGSFTGTITGASTFTYPLTSNPGSETVPGTVILGDVDELLDAATTYFSRSGVPSIYVLELGEGTATEGVAALITWQAANPNVVYQYVVPREWDANAAFLTFLLTQNGLSKKAYYMVTTTTANFSNYAGWKSVLTMVESPLVVEPGSAEMSIASVPAVTLSYAPSSVNKVTPLAYSYLYGVTAYPLPGNNATFATLKTGNVNVVGTGAEGGISNTILFYGHVMDGNPFNYWYSVDWAQINIELALANEVINGSNNPNAPLYFDQPGINRLQNRAAATMTQAVSYGLAIGTVVTTNLDAATFAANFAAGMYVDQLVINAVPFTTYTAANPGDYALGKYGGLTCVMTPARGFEQIIFNLNVTNFV